MVNIVSGPVSAAVDPSMPHAAGAMWPLLLAPGLALFGFHASRKGQPVFGRLLRAD